MLKVLKKVSLLAPEVEVLLRPEAWTLRIPPGVRVPQTNT